MQIRNSELTRVAVCLYYLNHKNIELMKTVGRISHFTIKG